MDPGRVTGVGPGTFDDAFWVHVKGRAFNIPPECACCLGPAATTFEAHAEYTEKTVEGIVFLTDVKTTTTRTLRFPICDFCALHSAQNLKAAFIAAGVALVTAIAGLVAAWPPRFFILAALALGVIVLFAVLYLTLTKRMAKTGPNCGSDEEPVMAKYPSFRSDPDLVGFRFTNRKYGERFAAANLPGAPPAA